jgi:hypothetical protein
MNQIVMGQKPILKDYRPERKNLGVHSTFIKTRLGQELGFNIQYSIIGGRDGSKKEM